LAQRNAGSNGVGLKIVEKPAAFLGNARFGPSNPLKPNRESIMLNLNGSVFGGAPNMFVQRGRE
jgi:hypothetical protein